MLLILLTVRRVFDSTVVYIPTDHAIYDRWLNPERVNPMFSKASRMLQNKEITYDQAEKMAKEEIQNACREGQVLLEYRKMRYIKWNDLFIPCVKASDSNSKYVVRSILTWDMVDSRKQYIVEKYLR